MAELLAVSVSRLLPVVGLDPNAAVTPVGKPVTARVTLPANGVTSLTLIVSVPLVACVNDRVEAEGESVKLPDPVTVMANDCVLLQELELVYVATYVLAPELNAMPLSWRALEVNPFVPAQLHVPLRGCGPRFTVDPEATLAVDACCQPAPFTCR